MTTGAVAAQSYNISLSPSSLSFGTAAEGYTPPAAQTVTVTNDGNWPVHLNTVSSTNYIAGAFGTTTLAAGASTTFTLQPAGGLTAGDRGETISVTTAEGSSASLSASFFVTSTSALSITIRPRAAFIVGQCGGNYEVTIGAGTPSTDLNASHLGHLTLTDAGHNVTVLAEGSDFSKRDGSIIVTLFERYLNSLPVGKYTLTATIAGGLYDGQTPSLVITVVNPGGDAGDVGADAPKAGDGTPVMLLVGLALVSGGILVLRRRRAKA